VQCVAGDTTVEVTSSKSATTTVSAAEDGQEQDDEQKIIHELLSRLEPPEVHHLIIVEITSFSILLIMWESDTWNVNDIKIQKAVIEFSTHLSIISLTALRKLTAVNHFRYVGMLSTFSLTSSSSSSSLAMGSILMGVRCLLHHLLPIALFHHWVDYFLQTCFEPLHDIIYPFFAWLSSLVLPSM